MSDTAYQPVSCQLHSEIELLTLHQQSCQVFIDDQDIPLAGIIRGVVIKDRAEFLQLQTVDGHLKDIRLDRIHQIKTD